MGLHTPRFTEQISTKNLVYIVSVKHTVTFKFYDSSNDENTQFTLINAEKINQGNEI
jgi:hypothetical protein